MFKSHPVIVRMAALVALPALLMVECAFAAATVEVPPSMTLRYGDLNLNSPEGVASLYKRIEHAATEVCKLAEGPQVVSLLHSPAWNRCYFHAISNAVQAVHNEKLSAYHWQRTRGWVDQEAETPATVARE
jgi:UrcA family protein